MRYSGGVERLQRLLSLTVPVFTSWDEGKPEKNGLCVSDIPIPSYTFYNNIHNVRSVKIAGNELQINSFVTLDPLSIQQVRTHHLKRPKRSHESSSKGLFESRFESPDNRGLHDEIPAGLL